MRRRPMLLVTAAATLAVVAAVGACAGTGVGEPGSTTSSGDGTHAEPGPTAAADPAYADRALAAPYPLLDTAFGPGTITEALPSTSWRFGTGRAMRVSDLVVTGRFTAWRHGTASSWSGPRDASTGAPVTWDDARAETRVLLMTFDVDTVVAAAPGVTSDTALRVAITVDAPYDAAAVARGLVAGGETVLLLAAPGDDGLWRVAFGGGLLGRVADDGVVTWGVLDAAARIDASRQALADSAAGVRVSDLAAAAERAPRTIALGG